MEIISTASSLGNCSNGQLLGMPLLSLSIHLMRSCASNSASNSPDAILAPSLCQGIESN